LSLGRGTGRSSYRNTRGGFHDQKRKKQVIEGGARTKVREGGYGSKLELHSHKDQKCKGSTPMRAAGKIEGPRKPETETQRNFATKYKRARCASLSSIKFPKRLGRELLVWCQKKKKKKK